MTGINFVLMKDDIELLKKFWQRYAESSMWDCHCPICGTVGDCEDWCILPFLAKIPCDVDEEDCKSPEYFLKNIKKEDIFVEVKLKDIVFPIPPISILGDMCIGALPKQLKEEEQDETKKDD